MRVKLLKDFFNFKLKKNHRFSPENIYRYFRIIETIL